MIPGEYQIQDGEIELNAGRPTVTVAVANTGDRPIQIGSHFHFFETNRYLEFDRAASFGQRLDIQFEFQSIPWKRCLAQLKANAVDGAFAVSYKPDRRELGEYPGGDNIDPSKRMHTDTYVVLRRKGSKVEWDGKRFSNLDGAVGFQLGYSVGDVLRAQNLEVDEGSQRADELEQKLLAGRLAAASMVLTRLTSGGTTGRPSVQPCS